jgi:hypothetical protein
MPGTRVRLRGPEHRSIVPGIHVFLLCWETKTFMAGSSPAMTGYCYGPLGSDLPIHYAFTGRLAWLVRGTPRFSDMWECVQSQLPPFL